MGIMRAQFFLISSNKGIQARYIKSRCGTLRIEAIYLKPSISRKWSGNSIS
jgi:hypothetical protein